MSMVMCNVHFTQQSQRTVYLSAPLIQKLKLSGLRSIPLHFGEKSVTAPVKSLKRSGYHLYLPALVRKMLLIPYRGKCVVYKSSSNSIRIGPLIGILTERQSLNLVKSYIKAFNANTYSFAFSPEEINWEDDTVNGFFLTEEGVWQARTVPLPDVVYNRLSNRRKESLIWMDSFKESFLSRQIPIFNWGFLNKWEVYHLLEKEEVKKYIPETYVDPSPKIIKEMLQRHQFVYLKPTSGSLGRGIYRLTYLPNKGYYARYRYNHRNVLERYPHFSRLMNSITRKRGRLQNYVVQQGIRLIELDGCQIDFRVHLNKNEENRWIVAGIGAKKAGRGSVTTHVKNGGQVLPPEQVLNPFFGSKGEDIIQRLHQVSIQLAEAIDRNYPHLIGELGFDIGVDKQGNLWMFEANAKPGRSIFKHPSLKKQGKKSLQYLVSYCLYLMKYRSGGEDV